MKKYNCLFCMLCFYVAILVPIITNDQLWEFGFLAGISLCGFSNELDKK